MKTYIITSPVKSGGKKHPPGSKLPLSPDEAGELLAVGAIGNEEEPSAHTTDPAPVMDEVSIIEAIQATLGDLGADDFKSDEYPKVKSVEALLKGRVDPALVTAVLVARAWDERPDKDAMNGNAEVPKSD